MHVFKPFSSHLPYQQKGVTLEPPSDPTITSLWVGNLLPDMTQQDLRDVFYAYGHIQSVHIIPQSKCAFVDYGDRAAAEYAASQLHNNCLVKGRSLTINWAKPRAQALCGSSSSDGSGNQATGSGGVMLPPGVKDVATYNLQAHMHVSGQPPLPPNPPPTGAGASAGAGVTTNSSSQPQPPAPSFSYLPVKGLNSAPDAAAVPAAKKPRTTQPVYAAMDPSQLGSKF
jgi:RNA recognition motif-containing protein